MELKCRLCGGRIKFADSSYTTKCEFCGITQFVFDYLDEDSGDYDEKVELIKEEKENFENSYSEYSDDVINADSYCLTSGDFRKIIEFFEKCGDYKDSTELLRLAKRRFVERVSSFSDCSIALKYIEEDSGLTAAEKEERKQGILDLGTSFTIVDLDEKGYLAVLPTEASAENLLRVMRKLSHAKDKDLEGLNRFEKAVVERGFREAADYIKANCTYAVNECSNINVIYEMRDVIPAIKKKIPELQGLEVEAILNERIQILNKQENSLKRNELEKEKRKKRKARFKKICIIAVALWVTLAITVSIINKVNGYSEKNISIAVKSKTNVKFNENTADGYNDAGYFYDFEFEITNNSPNDIRLIRGNFEILDKEGNTLSTSSLEMHCELKGNSTEMQWVHLNVSKGDNARELWNSELEDLIIKFKIKTIYFKDGTNKNYSDTKNRIIYPN